MHDDVTRAICRNLRCVGLRGVLDRPVRPRASQQRRPIVSRPIVNTVSTHVDVVAARARSDAEPRDASAYPEARLAEVQPERASLNILADIETHRGLLRHPGRPR